MNEMVGVIAVGCMIGSVIAICWNRQRTKRILRSLNEMLDRAIAGTFKEETMDESMLSAMESKLWKYLSASEISIGNVVAEKEKVKELISDISHQTKTPIANILLYTELLKEQDLHEEALEMVEMLNGQTEKLRFLIAFLVKMSRLETGILALYPSKAEIMPMLEKVYGQLETKAAEKELEFTLQPTDAKAVFDEKWTMEAIANIVENAIKYTEKGSVSIRVISYEIFQCIEIADTGIGIPEEEQAAIFTRFYRSSSVADTEGLGIGLYLSRQIISEEGGYMKVSSERNKGTKFFVYLPSDK